MVRDMDSTEVRQQLKEMMVSELNLEGKSPSDIDDSAPLFGDGLGLDSLDALVGAMKQNERATATYRAALEKALQLIGDALGA